MSNYVEKQFSCFYHCIENSEFYSLIVIILLIILSSIIIYIISKKTEIMLFTQALGSVFLILNFLVMKCNMFLLLWVYFGFFVLSLIFLVLIKYSVEKELRNNAIKSSGFLKGMESEFESEIFLIDTQKKRAFSHKNKIFISVGLLEILNNNEIKAVIAHETYHVKFSPNRLIATTLALSSMSFIRHNDEKNADKFSAENAGKKNLESALRKLKPRKWEKRIQEINN